ncbi:hypothetical protein BJ986_002149 [Phycicoccus badiiscoriae]|uniref:Uncharacterized protein n=1 Tax=Pedococcus badiiscoriae TaxID=642776 RepID=A0A852WR23_9MICO|nr:hypothetical protein [Pedococcus badiiscoriae]NYG07662.1 hypothetical protein [Pedococcus badiiscoriae]
MATPRQWTYSEVCRVASLEGSSAALGGAVTIALCGHWDHDGPCRWEHRTDVTAAGLEAGPEAGPEAGRDVVVTVRFDAPVEDEGEVRRLIRAALATGSLTGPDGATTIWALEA